MAVSDVLRQILAAGKTPLRLSLLVSLVPSSALALPAGLVVQGGSIAISQPDGSTLVIQQGTDRAAGDWNSFNIGAGERVTIQQPDASSLMLARVTGGVGTEIFGQLNANGGLLLVNPSGVLIGPGGMINTASFSASTLNVDPSRFMQGGPIQLQAQPGAPSDASVINRGTIAVADAGLVALLAPKVQNEGVITARLGTIQLASGTAATLDLSDQGLMNVVLDPGVSGSVLNQGQLRAQYVRIGGSEAQALVAAAVNLDGLIEAKGAGDAAGSVTVATGGDLQVNGVIDANGGATANGGTVKLLADRVALLDNAVVRASGGTGGGEVLIGGNYLGQGPEPNAKVAVLTPGAQVEADALDQGNGGRVILWSDDYTGFYGKISARGGANGGNGGFVETSSKANLQAMGQVKVTAPQGLGGTWLLDPADVDIQANPDLDVTFTNGVYTPDSGAAVSIIDADFLLQELYDGANITITTTNAGTDGGGNGNIKSSVALNYSAVSKTTNPNPVAGASLTLDAAGNILFSLGSDLPNVDVEVISAANFGLSGTELKVGSFKLGNVTGSAEFTNVLTTVLPGGVDIKADNVDVKSLIRAQGSGGIKIEANTVLTELTFSQAAEIQSAAGIAIKAPTISLLDKSAGAGTELKLTATGGDISIEASTGVITDGSILITTTNAVNPTVGGGKITFTGPTNSSTGSSSDDFLLLNAAGAITFNNNVGATTKYKGITITNSDGASFKGTVATTEDIKITDTNDNKAVTFEQNVTARDLITFNQPYSVNLTGTTNTFTLGVDFLNAGGGVQLGNGGDTFNFNGGLAFAGNPAVTLGGTLNVGTGAMNFGSGALTLAADTTVKTTNANITFGSTISDGPNNFTLTLDAGTGVISGTAANGAGAVSIAKLKVDDAASVSFAGNVDLSDTLVTANKTYTVTLTGAANSFANQVDFLNTGTVQLGDGSADNFSFAGGLLFTGNSPLKLAGNIKATNNLINFGNGGVTLLASSTVDTTNGVAGAAGGSITFGGTINATNAQVDNLTVTAGTNGASNVNFTNTVGATTALGALTVNSSGKTTFNNTVTAANVTTDAPGTAVLNANITALGTNNAANTFVKIQEIGGITLGTNLTIDTTAFGGDVILGTAGASVVDSDQTAGNSNFRTLTIKTTDASATNPPNKANVTIGAALGTNANKDLGAVDVQAAGITTFAGSIKAKSLTTDQPGSAVLSGAKIEATDNAGVGVQIAEDTLTIGNNLEIVSEGPVSLTTAGPNAKINSDTGNKNLKITANNNNNVLINGAVGNNVALGKIEILTAGLTAFASTVNAVSLETDANGTASLAGNITATGVDGVKIQENGGITLKTNLEINTEAANGDVILGSGGVVDSDQTAGSSNERSLTIKANNAGVGRQAAVTVTTLGTNLNKALGAVNIAAGGATTFSGAVKAKSVLTDAPGTAVLNGNITTTALAPNDNFVKIQEVGGITLGTDLTIDTTTADGNVILGTGGVVDSDQLAGASRQRNLTINANGPQINNADVTIGAALGTNLNKDLGVVLINASGQTKFESDLKIKDLVTDQPGTAVINSSTITETDPANDGVKIQENTITIGNVNGLTVNAQGPVTFNTLGASGQINSAAGNKRSLTITTANNNAVTFNGAVGPGGELGAITVNTAGLTTFASTVQAVSLLTDAPGTASLAGNIVTSGVDGVKILEQNGILLKGNVLIDTTAVDGDVIIGTAGPNSVVDSDQTAGNSNERNLKIFANGAPVRNATVTIGAALGTTANKQLGIVEINTSGATTFSAAVKAKSVTTDQPGSAVLNGPSIEATDPNGAGVQIREQTITLGSNLAITSQGPVTLSSTGGTIDSDTANNKRTLTITSPNNKDVTLDAAIGGTNELGAITVNTGGLTAFNSSVRAVSVETDQPGTASLAGNITASGPAGVKIQENQAQAVTLNGPVVITTTDAQANVQFDGGVNSKAGLFNNLTVNSLGNITFKGELGNTNSLGNLTLKTTGANKDIQIDGNTKANNVTLTATDELLIHGDIISPGFGNPAATNGFQTYTGNLKISNNVLFEGNIGVLNGVDYTIGSVPNYNGSNFTWTYKYNPRPTPPPPTPPTPPTPTPEPTPEPTPAAPQQAEAPQAPAPQATQTTVVPDVAGNLLQYQLSENKEVAGSTTTPPDGSNSGGSGGDSSTSSSSTTKDSKGAAAKTQDDPGGKVDNQTVDNKVCKNPDGCSSETAQATGTTP